MAVTVTKLDTPTDVSADLQEGGSLAANTTYYYRIAALSSYSPPLGLYGGRVWSPASEEISVTTTSTEKTVSLTWTAVSGANVYEIYRTTVSGDYAETSLHRICHKTLNYLYAPTSTNSYIDDGGAVLYNALFLEDGYPMVTIDGGTESSPYTQDDIYQALIDAGLSTKAGRLPVASRTAPQYTQFWFNCWISIKGWLKFTDGASIMHEGTISFENGEYGWLMGALSSTRNYGGAAYFRKFLYQGAQNYENNTIKIYNSYVKDLVADYGGGNLVLSNWYFVYMGKFYVRNSIYLHPALQLDGRAKGEILDSTLRWSMNSSAKISVNNNFLTTSNYPIYAYYATENTYIKNARWDTISYDMLFHKDYVPCNIDAINHTFKAEPPIGYALTRPENVTVNRKYEYNLKILDVYGNAIEGVKVEITNAGGETITPELSTSSGDVYLTSGTAASGSTVTLTDTSKNWVINSLTDYLIEIYDGTGKGQEGSIKSNTSNTITIKGTFATAPNSTSKYRIIILLKTHSYKGKAASPYYDTSTYTPFTMTISKDGYKTYNSIFTTEKKMDDIFTMELYEGPIYYHQQIDGSINQISLAGAINSNTISGKLEQETLQGSVVSTSLSGDIY